MIKGNQTWDQSSEEVSGSVFFLLLDCRKPSSAPHSCQRETKEAVAALQSISVGCGATDGKNKMFDQG